jgi:hypothetical protein
VPRQVLNQIQAHLSRLETLELRESMRLVTREARKAQR